MEANSQSNVRRVLVIEGLVNFFLLLAKLFVGWSMNSLVIMADAAHSLADLANNVIAWVVMKLAMHPPDESHPYGHRKFEILAVFALATLLSVVGFELVLSSFRRSDEPDVLSSDVALVMMLAVLCINLVTALWQRRKSRQYESKILEADADHTFADVLTTVAVIAGWQLAAHGFPWLDSVATLLVAGIIFWMSVGLYKKTLPALVDEVALSAVDVRGVVANLGGVESVSKVRSRWIGDRVSLDLVVAVDSKMATEDAHQIADNVEQCLYEQFGVADTTVHVEPHVEPDK